MNEKCEKVVNRGEGRWSQWSKCGRHAVMKHDGRHYCGMHDPVKRRAKQAERDAQWRAKFDAEIEHLKWKQAAQDLCFGVDRQTLERLGSGWLAKYLVQSETALRSHQGEGK
jgi:hypothetical protein